MTFLETVAVIVFVIGGIAATLYWLELQEDKHDG